MLKRSIALLVLTLTPAGVLLPQTPAAPARNDVPVKRVVLFSSGVGYFEHDGMVRGDATAELRFKTDQINDVLKSLVLQDRDGGRVTAVTYPSQAPLSRTLKSFQVDITANPSLAQLLEQLRGARITVLAQGQRYSGTILGVETRRKPTAVGEPVPVPTLDLLNGGTIRAIELPSVTDLSLEDPRLQEELNRALAALVQSRDQDRKPVTIDFAGTGERHVRIGYVVETPVWKTSYRLILGDRHDQLQGWAIVENQTESDWNDVSLSLVSGRPISFVMDLYQPLYATRPRVVPELYAGLHPQLYEDGISSARDSVAMQPARFGAALPATTAPLTVGRVRASQLSDVVVTGAGSEGGADLDQSVRSMATAENLGQLFEYSIGDVDLPRQKSAMLPIIADTIAAERVSIYNASVLPRNALTGVRLRNTTGKLLLQGPVTVIDRNTYAGDARIDDVPAGQERLLSYGVDLDLVVDNTKNTRNEVVLTAKIVKGALDIQRKILLAREYRMENKGDRDKLVLIEHPIQPGLTLADTQKPLETTATLYRFLGKAPAKKVATLTVKEQAVATEETSMIGPEATQLLASARGGAIPDAVRDAIRKAMQLRQQVADLDRQIAERDRQLGQITQEQARIREDMKTVASTTPYYARLLAKLNDQESAIERLQQERDDLTRRRTDKQRELDDYMNGLDVG